MRRPKATWCALVLVALLAMPEQARAQRVLGPGDDALVLPRGVLRVRVLSQWNRFDQRYGSNTPGRANGALEPLAIDFNLDTVGVAQFPNLARVQGGLGLLAGIPDFRLSLGRTVVNSSVTINVTPVVVEAGLTSKISVGLTVPIVKTRNDIAFDVNPAGREGNVGFIPSAQRGAFTDTTNKMLAQFSATVTQLRTNQANCVGVNSAYCNFLNSNAANAANLIASAGQFYVGLSQLYAVSPFIPVAGSEVQSSLEARVSSFNQSFKSLITGNPGSALNFLTTLPFASPSRLTVADAQTILTAQPFGVRADPLQTIERSHIGDIEFGTKYLFLDSFHGSTKARLDPHGFNYRSAVTGLIRFGTGQTDSPDNFIDVGTGGGQNDLELRSANDLLFGNHFWVSLTGRAVRQLKDDQTVRISDSPEKTLTAFYRRQKVQRDLGDYVEFEANPRYAINDYFQVTGHYFFRKKAEDKYSGRFEIDTLVTGFNDPTSPVPGKFVIDASTLNLETEQVEHRLGAGLSFSTIAAFEKGTSKIPLEITYLHFQTTRANGGNVPKLFADQVQLRVYARLFGK